MSATNQTGNSKDKSQEPTRLMKQIVSRENMTRAYKRVVKNKGVAGVDGLRTSELKAFLQSNWSRTWSCVIAK